MSNKVNDELRESLFEDGETMGELVGLEGEALQTFAEVYAKRNFEILREPRV